MDMRNLCHSSTELKFLEGAYGNGSETADALQKLLWLQQRRVMKAAKKRREAYVKYLGEAVEEDDAVKVLDMLDALYDQAVTETGSVAKLAAAQVKVLRAGVEITPMADSEATFTVAPGLEHALSAHPAHSLPIDPADAKALGIELGPDGRPAVYGLEK